MCAWCMHVNSYMHDAHTRHAFVCACARMYMYVYIHEYTIYVHGVCMFIYACTMHIHTLKCMCA